MKIARRTLALVICALMILSTMPTFAATYSTFAEKTFDFENNYTISTDVWHLGNAKDGSTVEVAADPTDSTNHALKIAQSDGSTSGVTASPFNYGSSAVQGPLSLEFDFYTTNTKCSFSINTRHSSGGVQTFYLLDGGVSNKGTATKYGSAKYEANTWYHVTYVADFKNAYVGLTLQEKGTRTIQGVQLFDLSYFKDSFSDGNFYGYTIGHQTKTAGDFYIDNLTQKTLSDFTLPTDEGQLYNTFSDTVWKFDGNNLGNYINTSVNGNYDESTGKTNTVALEKIGDVTALAMHQNDAQSGLQAIPYQSTSFTALHSKFSIMKKGGDIGNFGFNLKSGSYPQGSIIRMTGKEIYFMWKKIGEYDLNTWYDFDIKIDLTQKYAHLEMKASSDSSWKTYDMPYTNIYRPDKNQTATTMDTADKIYFQWYGNAADGGDVYITNYMQNTNSGLVPTMNAHNDSFDTLNIVQTSAAEANYTNGWYAQNFNASTAAIENVNGENMLKIESDEKVYAQISKEPMYSASNALHRIRVKMSGADDGSDRNILYATLNKYDTEYTKDIDVKVLEIKTTQFTLGDTAYSVALDADKMYDVEFVYDAANKKMVVSLTADDGTQYVGSVASATTAGTWGPLAKIMIQNATDANGGSICLDEFKWDILPSAAAVGTVTNENGTNNAALDEWVTVQLAETIDATCLDDVSVTLTKDGNACTTPYTLVADGEALIVKFTQLDKESTYVINVSGVKTLLGRTPEVGSLTFTTADSSFAVEKPVLSDSKISATVNSNYSHRKDGILVVAFYKGGCLTNITSTPLNTSKGITTTDIDISSYAGTYETIKAFVFDSLDGLYPYAENLVQ